jgi:DNA gyrase subunit B
VLTFFFRRMQALINHGYLYIAQPPLYRVQVGRQVDYAYSEEQKDVLLKKTSGRRGVQVQRYKGLGEMNPDQLWDTTMNPETRQMLRVNIDDLIEVENVFSTLMSEAVAPRKSFIQTYARTVKNLDI